MSAIFRKQVMSALNSSVIYSHKQATLLQRCTNVASAQCVHCLRGPKQLEHQRILLQQRTDHVGMMVFFQGRSGVDRVKSCLHSGHMLSK